MKKKSRYWFSFIGLAAGLCLLFFWNINSGSVNLTSGEIWEILNGKAGEDTAFHIIWDIRLPRLLSAGNNLLLKS